MIGGEEIYGTELTKVVFSVLCLMLAINLANLVYSVVVSCIKSRRKKKAKKAREEKLQKKEKEMALREAVMKQEEREPNKPYTQMTGFGAIEPLSPSLKMIQDA